MALTLATYNVHRWVGRDRRASTRRVLKVLRELDADVMALQEVEHRDGEGLTRLESFAAGIDATLIPGPTLWMPGSHYGNALLSRLPVLAVEHVDLSFRGREPRGAIDARLDGGGTTLRVIATHLGLLPAERRHQIGLLLERLPEQASAPDVLMGDLNEWLLWGRPLRWLRRHFSPARAPATFPSFHPVLALDRIWVRPSHLLRGCAVHRSPLAREASDHLPLMARMDWPAPTPTRY